MKRVALPQVTLCAATSVNVASTIRALEASLAQIDFAQCLLFTDALERSANPAIRIVPIGQLKSARAYSQFLLGHLADYIETSHCLVVQWDGHVVDAKRWDPAFLDQDYIGASWPQYRDGHNVGNGGFSLRSRQLLRACQASRFMGTAPEDIQICRTHRPWLEAQGLRFAPQELADRFSAERAGDPIASFGYHGVWHMPRVLGVERFWGVYRTLDERSTIRHDFGALLQQVVKGPGGVRRAVKLLTDHVLDTING
ncbi:MAG: DUF5672 family protein [Sphingomonas sp.]|jgi:hypothetical protein